MANQILLGIQSFVVIQRLVRNMLEVMRNPFDVTKAVDFSDQQIMDTWVDLPTAGGFFKLADPTSPMPLLLLGGKGSGRTHLMRYFSFPLQAMRHQDQATLSVLSDGYLGVYVRCSGLNAGRFNGKGQDSEVWRSIFCYYMDLWIAQLTLSMYGRLVSSDSKGEELSRNIASGVMSLFDRSDFGEPQSIDDMIGLLRSLQRELDVAINNAALTRTLDANIRATRGRLVFEIPQIVAKTWRALQGIQVLYLLDEFENLTADQQRYVNTLVREKEIPASFFIGSRLYGVRTLETYSAGEENKEGAEYESLRLDRLYHSDRDQYGEFARRIVAQRLRESGFSDLPRDDLAKRIGNFFEEIPRTRLGDAETAFVPKDSDSERLYLRRLRQQLNDAARRGLAPGIDGTQLVDEVITFLKIPEHPFIEKTNCFLLYRAWSDGEHLLEAAAGISADASEYASTNGESTQQAKVLDYFRSDLMAQLLRDYHQSQRYLGFDTFVDMSGGLLRNLLIILKNVFRWASFNGERPFLAEPLSLRAQQAGVSEAANWFFNDAQLLGEFGDDVRDGVTRLANMFRRMRFSDKPSESSLATFSADLARCSKETRATVRSAEAWSLLVGVEAGQRERNTEQVDAKLQLHPMLCPRWDLPIYRRGAVSLTPAEMEAIFGRSAGPESYEDLVSRRLSRLNAPFRQQTTDQDRLPGFDDA
jgi:hypothetical protein